jgi:hypothetical protein
MILCWFVRQYNKYYKYKTIKYSYLRWGYLLLLHISVHVLRHLQVGSDVFFRYIYIYIFICLFLIRKSHVPRTLLYVKVFGCIWNFIHIFK